MPTWAWFLWSAYSVVILAWMGWITREVLMHGKELAEINTRCHGREEWLRQSVLDVKNLEERLARIDRNLIRVGIVSGVDTGELEKE